MSLVESSSLEIMIKSSWEARALWALAAIDARSNPETDLLKRVKKVLRATSSKPLMISLSDDDKQRLIAAEQFYRSNPTTLDHGPVGTQTASGNSYDSGIASLMMKIRR